VNAIDADVADSNSAKARTKVFRITIQSPFWYFMETITLAMRQRSAAASGARKDAVASTAADQFAMRRAGSVAMKPAAAGMADPDDL